MTFYTKKQLKYNLQPADIILVHGDSYISKIIQTISKSHWNHAIMYLGNEKFIESDWNGVVIGDLEKLTARDIRILRYKNLPINEAINIATYTKQFEGKKYDFWGLAELGLMYIIGKRGISRDIGSKNKFICSELVSLPYQIFGYTIIDKLDYDEITPGDFDISKNFKRIEL